jgi:proline iminopeptidase
MRAILTSMLLILTVACDRGLTPGEGRVDVRGGKVWYRIAGSGNKTPLLLLHGGPGFPSYYLDRLVALADERPVIFYDQLGCGRSDRPNDPSLWTLERFVAELAQIREALHLKEVHILGHSWGTQLLMEYLQTKPKGIRSLILSGPAVSVPRWLQDAAKLRAELPEETQETLTRHEQDGTTDSQEYQKATEVFYKRHLCRLDPWPREMEQTLAGFSPDVYGTMWGPTEFFATGSLKDYDRSAELENIRVPTLFISGRYDEATPETTAWYSRQVPGSSIVILEESSHMAMLEETDKYVAAVREFLHKVERQ